jgi:anthrone oxygenase-like protein
VESVLKLIAVLSAAVFSGAAFYISLVEHPARLDLDPIPAIMEFRLTYRRAAPIQATAAALAFLTGLVVSVLTGDWTWALGAVCLGSVIPLTLVVFMPTNRRLLGDDRLGAEAPRLLRHWGRLHSIRTALGMVGLVLMLWAGLRLR